MFAIIFVQYYLIIGIKKRYIAMKKKFLQVFSMLQNTSVIYKDTVFLKGFIFTQYINSCKVGIDNKVKERCSLIY